LPKIILLKLVYIRAKKIDVDLILIKLVLFIKE